MGFFLEEPVVAIVGKVRPTRAKAGKESSKASAMATGVRGCVGCPLQGTWGTTATPKMPTRMPKHPEDARVLLLGSAPGADQDKAGVPILTDRGPGKMLWDLIPSRDRGIVATQNSVRCTRLPSGNPSAQEQHCCSLHLDNDVVAAGIGYVIGIGPAPLAHYWPGASVLRVNGVAFPVRMGGTDEKPHVVWYYPVMEPEYVESFGGMRRAAGHTLRADIVRFFKERATMGKPRIADMRAADVIIATTLEMATKLTAQMEGVLGVDIETSKLKPYEIGGKIITAAISDGVTTIAFAVDHPELHNDWALPFLLDVVRTRPWAAHNAAFEMVWFLHHCDHLDGYSTKLASFDDSQAFARLYFERETIASLAMVSHAVLGVNIKTMTGVNSAKIMEYTLAEVLPYNGLDAQASALIVRRLTGRVDAVNYQRLIESVRTTAMMELMGLPVDLDAANAIKQEWGEVDSNGKGYGKVGDIVARTRKLYEVKQYELVRQQPFNLGSTDDVGIALVEYGKLTLPPRAGGKYVTDDAALSKATENAPNPLVTAVLEYREATKLVSTYVEPILATAHRYTDKLLHPSYTVMLTATERLSCFDPNIQNFPNRKHKEIRRMVVPPKNHIFCAVDYGQLEARVIAMAAMDKVLCDAIIKGYDIHGAWRDRILTVYPQYIERIKEKTGKTSHKDLMKGGRTIIKTDFVFASFFGAQVKTCAMRTGIPEHIMHDIAGEFWREFYGVQKWIKGKRREYEDTGVVRTLTGRARRGLLWGNETINTPVQGTAANVVVDAMNAMRDVALDLNEPALMPRINIHDDLSFFLPDSDDLEDYIDIICQVLTALRYPWQVVPFMVEVSVGPNWAQLEEVTTYTGKYHR